MHPYGRVDFRTYAQGAAGSAVLHSQIQFQAEHYSELGVPVLHPSGRHPGTSVEGEASSVPEAAVETEVIRV